MCRIHDFDVSDFFLGVSELGRAFYALGSGVAISGAVVVVDGHAEALDGDLRLSNRLQKLDRRLCLLHYLLIYQPHPLLQRTLYLYETRLPQYLKS